jgi:endonuclease/exonuclease/phosphatase family metal-dependent hydrolase
LKFDQPYELVGPTDVQAALIINTATVTLQRDVELVDDVCLNDETSSVPRLRRQYPLAALKENSTDAAFTIIGVHLARDYSPSSETDCLARNATAIRDRLHNEPGATFAAGDFNFRSTEMPYECDPYETGAPAHWWSVMTEPGEAGRTYLDAVRTFHRQRSLPMVDEWTYQHPGPSLMCNGATGIRRSRIDYIFSSGAVVAEAHADHPGWADPVNFQYSDHRYVLGRFVLTGPPRPFRPDAAQAVDGVINLTWAPVDGVSQWIVYRAKAGYDYQQLVRLAEGVVSFEDHATEHDEIYRYALAPVGVDSGQGVESPPVWAQADARGPHVSSISPGRGAVNVDPQVTIRATFDEWVEAASVGDSTVSIYRNGNRIPGRLIREGGFVLKFDPAFALKKGETFTIVVRPVRDKLGNAGLVFKSRFSTVPPPKKRRHHRR